MLCPSLKAATENSIGIVGMLSGGAPTSNALRPMRDALAALLR
jgi:hypothetical protein